jgi:Leucine-rich repeat (LRR) protein
MVIKHFPTLRLLQLASLTKLSLHNCGLCKLESLPYLPNLTSLDASFNQLTRLEGLGSSHSQGVHGSSSSQSNDIAEVTRGWGKLAELDVSHNSISTLQGSCLAGLRGLTALDLSFNNLASPADLGSLSRWVSMNNARL